jgi:hypothetical protein
MTQLVCGRTLRHSRASLCPPGAFLHWPMRSTILQKDRCSRAVLDSFPISETRAGIGSAYSVIWGPAHGQPRHPTNVSDCSNRRRQRKPRKLPMPRAWIGSPAGPSSASGVTPSAECNSVMEPRRRISVPTVADAQRGSASEALAHPCSAAHYGATQTRPSRNEIHTRRVPR